MKCILGKKVGSLQVLDVNGRVWPATVVYCEPNKVIEVKTKAKDGFDAAKVGFDSCDIKKLNKAQAGVFKKAKTDKAYKNIRQLRNVTGVEVGQEITVDEFKPGQYVDIQGTTKGRGFTGAIKRWNFKIGPLSHGAGFPHRYQGSIAMGRGGSQAQRVKKGQKMSGHYGHETVTIQNLVILYVNKKLNTMTIMGAIPGPVDGTVLIKSSVKKSQKTVSLPEMITKAALEEIKKENEMLQDKATMHEINKEIDKQEKAQEEAKSQAKKVEGK